jgi:hypothetical protein
MPALHIAMQGYVSLNCIGFYVGSTEYESWPYLGTDACFLLSLNVCFLPDRHFQGFPPAPRLRGPVGTLSSPPSYSIFLIHSSFFTSLSSSFFLQFSLISTFSYFVPLNLLPRCKIITMLSVSTPYAISHSTNALEEMCCETTKEWPCLVSLYETLFSFLLQQPRPG